MMTRIAVVFLAFSLVPTLAEAQRRGSGRTGTRVSSPGGRLSGPAMTIGSSHRSGHRSGHRYGHGHFRPVSLVAPPAGYGNINHPGLGFAPNTPGIGVPLAQGIQPLPTRNHHLIGPIRPGVTDFGRPHRHGKRYRSRYSSRYRSYYNYGSSYGAGGVAVVGVPVVVGGGYGYYPQQPQVIIVQQPAYQGQLQAQEPPRHMPGKILTEREAEQRGLIYETRPPLAQERPTKPLTLLVFKNHSIYAVSEYWKEDDSICYVTSYGSQNCVSLDLLDVEFTKKLNEERSIKFEL
jgi:hypothetical protein